jgi:hypothetical protein
MFSKELLWLLGYLNEDQWKDAFKQKELGLNELTKYKNAVEDFYQMTINTKETE